MRFEKITAALQSYALTTDVTLTQEKLFTDLTQNISTKVSQSNFKEKT